MDIEYSRKLLESITLGTIAAERDTNLVEWFVNTNAFRRVTSGDINLVLGPKGTGKTAIYKYLIENQGFIEGLAEYKMIPMSDLQGITDFQQLLSISKGEAEDYRGLWKLYFALRLARAIISQSGIWNIEASRLLALLRESGFHQPSQISKFGQWLAGIISNIKVGVAYHGVPISIGMDIRGGEVYEKSLDIWELMSEIQDVLSGISREAWILVDRLDEIFSGMTEEKILRENALKGLMATILDFDEFKNMKSLIFMRTDIYDRLSFTNKDHLSDRNLRLGWDRNDLIILIARRMAASSNVREHCGVDVETSEIGINEAKEILESILKGENESKPYARIESIINILEDGKRQVTPRDLIYLFSESRRLQLEDIERGIFESDSPVLPLKIIEEAFKIVSRNKVNDFVLGEFPEVEDIIKWLKGQNSSIFSRSTLNSIITELQIPVDEMIANL